MSQTSLNLGLPFIQAAQAQKHVTHNEAIRQLDLITQLSVESDQLDTPPSDATPGQRYVVKSSSAAEWAGHDGEIAVYQNNAWEFLPPQAGWTCWVRDRGSQIVFNGAEWIAATVALPESLPRLGIGGGADANHILSVSGASTLLTGTADDHRLVVNKTAEADTASLVFQSGFSGRAELGLTGSNDFAIKVSTNGADFVDALVVEPQTGRVTLPAGATMPAPQDYSPDLSVTAGYIASRTGTLVTNGTGALGTRYNYPEAFQFDPTLTPGLPASFRFDGYYPGIAFMQEPINIDPNRVYRLSSYIRQGVSDVTGVSHAHSQYMGLACLDVDDLEIQAMHHMRFTHGGIDSRTALAAPLSPGDTTISVVDASGWNEASTASHHRGIIVFGYRNSLGYRYDHYSRLVEFDLFDIGDVDKAMGVITLNKPLPASMGNPDDPNGTWPSGTAIANSSSGGSYKYVGYSNLQVPQTDAWYRTESYIGGVDTSGQNVTENFSPGTVRVKLFFLPNFSNRAGGTGAYWDTGPAHSVWFTGLSIRESEGGRLVPKTVANQSGAFSIEIPTADAATGALSMGVAQQTVEAV